MRLMWTSTRLALLLTLLTVCTRNEVCMAKVYMVRIVGDPIVLYQGSILGYPATAPATNGRFNSNSVSAQIYKRYLQSIQDAMMDSVFNGEHYVKLYSYVNTVNGFAVSMSEEQAARMAAHPSVLSVEPNRRVQALTTHTPDYLGLPTGAWNLSGGVSLAGEGMVIGMIDTGINPAHPSFANDSTNFYEPLPSFRGSCEVAAEFPRGSCNGKLIAARHFSAGAEADGNFNATLDFASPLDGDGHGTHTASTAAGNYGVPVLVQGQYFGLASGMAPRARLSIYKCLYRSFGGTFADIVAGIDQAVADGVDVLNLSLGPSGQGSTEVVYLSIFDIALLGAVKAGVTAIQSAGNNGPFSSTVASWSPWIISVAAGSTDREYSISITLGNGRNLTGQGLSIGSNSSNFETVVFSTDVNISSDDPSPFFHSVNECQYYLNFNKSLVEGRILVCSYTLDISFGAVASVEAVADTLRNLSAAGVIFILAQGSLADLSTTLLPEGFPSVILSGNDADAFLSYYNESTTVGNKTFGATARFNGGTQTVFTGASPIVASFSSRGPSFDNEITLVPSDVLKPNILAPGVDIWGAWSPIGIDENQFQGENFAIISGTSMAAPHIAGIAALIKAHNPTFSPAAIHSAIAGTAYSIDANGSPLQASLPPNVSAAVTSRRRGPATPFDLGAGQVDATAAFNPGLVFEADFLDYVRFICVTPLVNSTDVIQATGVECPETEFDFQSDLNSPYISIGVLNGTRSVSRTVTNVGLLEEMYSVKLVAPPNVTTTLYPDLFTIAPGGNQTLQLNFTSLIETNIGRFGSLRFEGNLGHNITIPITIAVTSP